MRYIRTKKIVHNVCDTIVKDDKIIKEIVQQVCKKNIYCSMVLNRNGLTLSFPKTRIVDTSDNGFQYITFRDVASVKDTSTYENIKELKVESEIIKKEENNPTQDELFLTLDFN